MAQYHNEKSGLIIGEKYCNTLDIQGFAQMMKDPSYCYKFYWLAFLQRQMNPFNGAISIL